jgi:hypothetical protein
MNGKQHYQHNTNQSIPNNQEQLPYTLPSLVDNTELWSNKQSTEVPRARERGERIKIKREFLPSPMNNSAKLGSQFK